MRNYRNPQKSFKIRENSQKFKKILQKSAKNLKESSKAWRTGESKESKKNSPSVVTILHLAKSALFPTKITAFCAIFSDIQSVWRILSAMRKLLLSDDEYITQNPCGS